MSKGTKGKQSSSGTKGPGNVTRPMNPNYPSTTGKPSGGNRGNTSKK